MADPTSPTLEVDDNADLFAGMKKKKKKSTKAAVDLDLDAPAPVAAESIDTSLPVEKATEETGQNADDLDFSDLKKKKKSKKTVRIASDDEDLEAIAPKPAKKTDKLGNEVEEVEAPISADQKASETTGEADDEFADLKKMKKKKGSKKSTFDLEAFEAELAATEAGEANNAETKEGGSGKGTPLGSDDEGDDEVIEGEDPFAKEGEEGQLTKAEKAAEEKLWLKEGDRDYHYSELLGRFYSLLYATHPSLSSSGVKKKYTIPPPQMHREGNKRSIFANVVDICKKMHRQPEHVIQFLFAELGTSGSVDGKGMLVIKGRFQQKQMENVLRRYIVEYVTCKTCKSPDTLLTKDNRLFFMTCESCGSTRSVSAIKSGFQAQTGKRRAQRAAA